ncbi:MAG TPA: hypothetical protein VND21_12460, partial [Planctomycetota bacterium]|nr:hypothetical protein [Planctomycetota bacterium]
MVRTRGRQDGGRRLAALLALSLSLSLAAGASPAPARAEDAPRAADASGEPVRLDFDGFRAPPAPRAANGLWVPTDEGYAGAWTEPFGTPSGEEGAPAVQAFQEPWTPLHALAPEVVEDLLRRLVPEGAGGGWASRATTEGIEVWTTPSNRPRVARALDFVREAFAPRLVVLADLVGTDKGEQVTLASGAVGLLPRRWTTIVHRRDTKLHVVGYAAEVAQEAVVARPLVASIPSGEEIYARWTPGETVSVLEVFAGDLDARDPVEIDLSTLRLTPEAAGPGRVVLPRTAVRRARTAILLPAGKATEAEVVWSSADGTRRLRLRVDTATAAPQDLPLGEDRVGVVRAGAATAALEGAPREGGPEASVRAFQSSGATDVTLEPLAQAFVLATGGADVVERLRAAVRRGEATLSGATVEIVAVELLAASSAWAREAVVGKALPAAASPAVEQAPVLWSVRVPVLGGVPPAGKVTVVS